VLKRIIYFRTENVEINKQLRTKAMREAGKGNTIYNYAIIRIKFPDERLLQGKFISATARCASA